MVIIKLPTALKYSIVYIKYTSRRNDLMNIDVVDLNSSKVEVATVFRLSERFTSSRIIQLDNLAMPECQISYNPSHPITIISSDMLFKNSRKSSSSR